jgi:glutamate racemase
VKIGVFDSGVGGLSVANAIKMALPRHKVILRQDKRHLPYGTKSPDQLKHFVLPIIESLVEEGCRVVVIACNTVTTTIIPWLRKQLRVPLVGIEPMVKPAAERTKSKVIAVCATPATLDSARYKWLKDTYARGVQVLEPDCGDWTRLIETNQIDRGHVHDQIDSVCQAGADQIVLGCTHYHWIEDIVSEVAAGRAEVIQPEQAVIKHLKRVLEQLA